jgi:hypothetical protein
MKSGTCAGEEERQHGSVSYQIFVLVNELNSTRTSFAFAISSSVGAARKDDAPKERPGGEVRICTAVSSV